MFDKTRVCSANLRWTAKGERRVKLKFDKNGLMVLVLDIVDDEDLIRSTQVSIVTDLINAPYC